MPGNAPIFPNTAPLTGDVICISCGYNLRGLARDSLCPECGKPVALSLRTDLLSLSSLDWRRNVAMGAKMLACILPLLIALRLLLIYHFARRLVPLQLPRLNLMEPWNSLIAMIYDVLLVIAIWKTTTYESAIHPASIKLAAKARLFAIINFILAFLTMGCLGAFGSMEGSMIVLIQGLVGAAGVETFYRYLANLAARIPDPPLSARLSIINRVYPIALIVGFVIYQILYLGGIGPPDLRVLIALPGLVVATACATWAIFLLNEFANRLKSMPTE